MQKCTVVDKSVICCLFFLGSVCFASVINVHVYLFNFKILLCLSSLPLFEHSVDTVEAAFAMEPEEFKAKYGVTKPALDAPELVFQCQMGKRGGIATAKAHEIGYIK